MARARANRGGKKQKRITKLLPKKPKKPSSGFGAFLKEFWVSITDPQNRTRQSLREASARWRAMTAEQKNGYKTKVAADRSRYLREMTEWKRQKTFLTRPASIYAMFVKDVWQREKNNNNAAALNIQQVGQMASTEWHNLADEFKQQYRVRFLRAKRNYDLSIRDFKAGLNVNLDRQLDTNELYVPLLPVQEEPEPEPEDLDFDDDDMFDDMDDEFLLDEDF